MAGVRTPDVSDAELLAATRSDPEAFACFYDRYESPILGYLMRRTGDAEVSADLAGEVFAAALSAAHKYRAKGPTAAPWLFAIAHNILVGSLRRGRVEAGARRRVGIERASASSLDDYERVEAAAGREDWAVELLDRLPPDQRDAVQARILDERPYSEIARQLETSEFVVRKRVSRGLTALRQELERSS